MFGTEGSRNQANSLPRQTTRIPTPRRTRPLFQSLQTSPEPEEERHRRLTQSHHLPLSRHIAAVPDRRVNSSAGRAGCLCSPLAAAGHQLSGVRSQLQPPNRPTDTEPLLTPGSGSEQQRCHTIHAVTLSPTLHVLYGPYQPRVRRGSQIPRFRIILALRWYPQGPHLASTGSRERKGGECLSLLP